MFSAIAGILIAVLARSGEQADSAQLTIIGE